MAKLKFSGPLLLRTRSLLTITRIAFATYLRHAAGRRLASDWNAEFEIGIKFWRHQFTAAMSDPDFAHGRQLFDSLQTETDDLYEVVTEPCAAPKGMWYRPRKPLTDVTVLYCHGGGYAFHGATSARFAAMLSHHIGAPLFAPDYRLTPEHVHPAQSDDAFSAWQYLAGTHRPERIVVIGDSAGGHLALMLLQKLKAAGLAQPAVCIGLCPWTDIGDRGASLHANDRYDLVQGWMALRFGEWLDPDRKFGRETLSPIFQDFAGLCPIYLQAGGREILRDMIVEFAEIQRAKGADVTLDLWPDMPHDFQAYDSLKHSSSEALTKLARIVRSHGAPSQLKQN
ncbi:alpha/beta hydrolase [Devosia sp.]|uniref:alpha/beta hydrolase n=1 Tax=Devosia sp. TaxID=1871048 RepID=UPI002734E00D|nr:alpha/beta hydrolase [Devosia sp.]MDP2781211.1 alpha/beta hydrolase [Devosia sp.]